MKTWKGVIKFFVCCLGVVITAFFLVMALMWTMETDMEIDCLKRDMKTLQENMEILKAQQNLLIPIAWGRYLPIFTKEKEVVIETTRGTR